LTRKDHELLAQTGAGTPMGDLLRRYWVPALLAEELPECDGTPVRVRLLGENLIAFRDSTGQVGLLDEHCAHRGASLYFACNAGGGLRCAYHGWKYDLAGRCVDMPNEPPTSKFRHKIRQRAYPCQERGGVVWTYMGPADDVPPLPDLECLLVPDSHRYVSKRLQQCHWTQGMDGDMDSSHLAFLHSEPLGDRRRQGSKTAAWLLDDTAPEIEVLDTDYGVLLGARRAADADTYYWRINQWLMPWYTYIPPFTGDVPIPGHAWVPIDDITCWAYTFSWHPTRPLREDERARMRRGDALYSELIPGTYRPKRNKDNDYTDPDAPANGQPWRRIRELQDQDVSMTEGMGPLYDRTRERLSPSDVAIIRVRRQLIAAVKRLRREGRLARARPEAYRVRPVCVVLPRAVTDWAGAVGDAMEARPETFVPSA
jgi:phenylpropionate dioxygenase-like ring-hydroxylating dioxygenase large terminal subunit